MWSVLAWRLRWTPARSHPAFLTSPAQKSLRTFGPRQWEPTLTANRWLAVNSTIDFVIAAYSPFALYRRAVRPRSKYRAGESRGGTASESVAIRHDAACVRRTAFVETLPAIAGRLEGFFFSCFVLSSVEKSKRLHEIPSPPSGNSFVRSPVLGFSFLPVFL